MFSTGAMGRVPITLSAGICQDSSFHKNRLLQICYSTLQDINGLTLGSANVVNPQYGNEH